MLEFLYLRKIGDHQCVTTVIYLVTNVSEFLCAPGLWHNNCNPWRNISHQGFDFQLFWRWRSCNYYTRKNETIELQEPFGISEYGYKQTRFIPSKEFVKIILPVKFIKVGQALILISAISSVAGDVLEQKITVKVGHFILKIAVTCSCLAIF